MFLNKTLKKLLGFGLVLSILTISGCTIYKTINVSPVSGEKLEFTYRYKKMVVLHVNKYYHGEYLLSQFQVEGDTLKGWLEEAPEGKRHPYKAHSFRKGKVKAYPPQVTMHIYTNLKEIEAGEFEIPISDIVGVEIHEKNHVASIFASVGVGAATIVGAGVAIIAIACTCPKVESVGPDGSLQHHGSLFPGALLKSLERDDYLILDKLKTGTVENLKFKISNPLKETQFIDQLAVLQVEHPGFNKLALSNENKLIAYNESLPATKVLEGTGKNITDMLKQEDNVNYDFDQYDSFEQLNEIILQFDRSKFVDHPSLIIRGQQTSWLDTVGNYIIHQGGASFDKWVDRKDDSGGKKWKKNSSKNGLSLNVYMKLNDKWEYVGTHHEVGTAAKRNVAMSLDVSKVHSDHIEIKLVSAYKLWELDHVGLANEWKTDLKVNTLNLIAASNQEGENVLEAVNSADKNYLTQKEGDTFVNIEVQAPSDIAASTIVLKGRGYYHYNSKYENKANMKFFRQIRNELGIQDVSKALDFYMNTVATN